MTASTESLATGNAEALPSTTCNPDHDSLAADSELIISALRLSVFRKSGVAAPFVGNFCRTSRWDSRSGRCYYGAKCR